MVSLLQEKIKLSKLIIKSVTKQQDPQNIYVAWSGGKDSTVLLHIIKTMYKGRIPFKVGFAETYLEISEIYQFINFLSKKWSLKLEKDCFLNKNIAKRLEKEKNIQNIFKTLKESRKRLLPKVIKKRKIKVLFWGARLDDNPKRNLDFFQKKYGALFVYPLLHFNEKDIWDYTEKFNLPYVQLYKKGYHNIPIRPLLKNSILSKFNLLPTQ